MDHSLLTSLRSLDQVDRYLLAREGLAALERARPWRVGANEPGLLDRLDAAMGRAGTAVQEAMSYGASLPGRAVDALQAELLESARDLRGLAVETAQAGLDLSTAAIDSLAEDAITVAAALGEGAGQLVSNWGSGLGDAFRSTWPVLLLVGAGALVVAGGAGYLLLSGGGQALLRGAGGALAGAGAAAARAAL